MSSCEALTPRAPASSCRRWSAGSSPRRPTRRSTWSTPGGGEGHIGPVQDPNEGPAVISYVLVEDLDATASEIEANGGKA